MIRAITQLYRFLFSALVIIAVALPIIGFLVSPKLDYPPIMAVIGMIFYVFFLVIIVGALAVQLDNNRLLTLIAEGQKGQPNSQRDTAASVASRRTISPPLRTNKQAADDSDD
ncbi:hypothetical protein [Roseobacter sp. HKCCD5988]|uniref:hypothetical protein n=1 Tax=Roseobacter sp. HKCCD5988 TaxID=3120338 RepID=UPI0030ECEC5C